MCIYVCSYVSLYQVLRPRLSTALSVVAVVVVAVLTLTRIVKSVVTGQAPVTLELRNTPGKKHKPTKDGTRIYHS